ncbi:MAG TPA: peptide ABC transporter substrate-binding protein [Chloroflexota bacterium]|jgi:peptide/nickel transport system substrate-binding protein
MTRIGLSGRAALLIVAMVLGGSGAIDAAARPAYRAATVTTTLIYGAAGEPDTLNPWTTVEGNTNDVAPAIFDSLLRVDARGRLQPDLATKVEHTADGRTWTFHLRHGVRWADGAPFTSADVAYNYRAIFDKAHNVTNTTGWDQIDRSSTPDAYTFVCHLKAVNAPFLVNVGWSLLIPAHIYNRPGVNFNTTPFNRAPFGTGPYRVTEWMTGDHIILAPNPYSWRGQPFFTKVIYKIAPDRNSLLAQLKTGEVDMGAILPQQVVQARGIAGKRVVTWLNNGYWHVDLTQYGFLRERAVRQALDYATPKEAIFKGIGLGMGAIADANVSPAVGSYYNPKVPKHAFSMARAAAMLTADGFIKGSDGVLRKNSLAFAMTLWTSAGDHTGERIDQVLRQEWGQLGIKIRLRSIGGNQIYGPDGPYFTRAMAGVTIVNANNPDPDDSLYWISAGIPKTPTDNTCCDSLAYFYRPDFQAQVDALYRAGNGAVDPVRRRAIYFKIQALLADEAPVIFLYWETQAMALPSNLTGFVANPFLPAFATVGSWRRA